MYPSFLPNNADIIIVGAGISGMSAAFYILEKEPSLNVLVLEAKRMHAYKIVLETFLLLKFYFSERIGGRTFSIPLKTDKTNFRSYDLGGQFVSSSQVHLVDLINKLGLKLVKPPKKMGKTIWNLDKDQITEITGSLLDLKTVQERLELFKFFERVCIYIYRRFQDI